MHPLPSKENQAPFADGEGLDSADEDVRDVRRKHMGMGMGLVICCF